MFFSLLCFLSSVAHASWDYRPIVQPVISGHVVQAGQTYVGAKLGVVLGFAYDHDDLPLQGRTRALYAQTFGGLGYSQVRFGSFLGPKLGPLSIDVGPDYLYDDYDIASVYSGATSSVALPLRGAFDLKIVRVEAVAGPIFFVATHAGTSRQSINNSPIGFGDEFFYGLSGDLGLGPMGFGVSYNVRQTVYGDDNFIGIRLGLLRASGG